MKDRPCVKNTDAFFDIFHKILEKPKYKLDKNAIRW